MKDLKNVMKFMVLATVFLAALTFVTFIQNRLVSETILFNQQKVYYKSELTYNFNILNIIEHRFNFKNNNQRTNQNEILVTDQFQLSCELCSTLDTYLRVIDSQNNEVYSGLYKKDLTGLISKTGQYTFQLTYTLENNEVLTINMVQPIRVMPKIELNRTQVNQGSYVKIQVNQIDLIDEYSIRSNIKELENIPLYKENDMYVAYIPIRSTLDPKEYTIDFYVNQKKFLSKVINVIDVEYKNQYLTISQDVLDASTNKEAINEFNTAFDQAQSNFLSERLYEEPFIMPVKGDITTEFGLQRYTNGATTASIHKGIDIATELRKQVKASATGKVIYADFLKTTGNTIIIDHGQGILTYYFHLDRILIGKGSLVKQGDYIGLVGSTGNSTGPHLHFGLSIDGIFINPYEFIKK